MSATRWELVQTLFAGALEQPPEQRGDYLAVATEDEEVRREVLSLLLAHKGRGRFDSVADQLHGLRPAAPSVPLAAVVDRLRTALAGRYAMEGELGQGGMALVFLAQDLKHHRPVAIKVLKPELASALGSERFLREIEITATLTHPNILTLLDSGEAGPFLYYVMPYVEGESLRQRLRREGRVALEDALRIVREVADALDYSHRRGILHRDVKPENILFEAGHAVVTDFGIARAVSEMGAERLTRTGAVGTPAYMSPEQATGQREVDARTDVYSLGCVLYEMLGGAPPFDGPTPQAILARKFTDPEPTLARAPQKVPKPVERVIMRALAVSPADRHATAAQFAASLQRAYSETVWSRTVPGPGWRFLLHSPVGIAVLLVLLSALGAGTWLFVRSARTQWALERGLPEIQRLIDHREVVAAYRLARQVEPYVTTNPEFQRLWRESSLPVSIRTTPAGARVSITDYRPTTDDWLIVGISPIEETRVPAGHFRFRIERAGFQTIEAGSAGHFGNSVIEFTLQREAEHPDMIWVPGGPVQVRSLPPVRLSPYWLDRFEVTNRLFKAFVDAGGYQQQEFWTYPIILEDRAVPWEQAITSLVDGTGRPGPSTWELGTYPQGMDDIPVSGLSWYEAAAYCQSAGKKLPTFYHWYNAAGFTQFFDILTVSNLRTSARSAEGPAVVGAFRGIGPYGHYDMAGNVREWVLNPVGGRHYILGGAWSDPGYMFYQPNAMAPADRSPQNGFRCASFTAESTHALGAGVDVLRREYRRNPVSAGAFRIYRELYSYERTPLNSKVESVDEESPYWRRETISFDAPYGKDRIIIHLFLPKEGEPPYQAVVHFPPDAMFSQSSRDVHTKWFDFLVRTGRAVVYTVVEGTHERHAARGLLRERVIHWTMDIGLAIDYLETRHDIDATKLAYYGLFGGAARGPIFTAVETRFKGSVLLAGGLFSEESAPEIEPANFAPRATVPVLMVNGQDDFFFPLEAAQLPLFRLLGAPQHAKRHVLVEGGTNPNDWQQVVKEILDWLDRYLGPVK